MHPNPAFRQEPQERHLDFAAQTGFGMLCATPAPDQAPLLAHVPFLLSSDRLSAELHLVRANPIVKIKTDPLPAVIAIQGPHAYISPDWYETEQQVPTWNYVAVHLRGALIRLEQGEIRRVVDELSAHFESRIDGKTPWRSAKLQAEALERMLIQIVPYRFEIEEVNGTWKLNQNKPEDARMSAAERVSGSTIGQETAALAALMQDDRRG